MNAQWKVGGDGGDAHAVVLRTGSAQFAVCGKAMLAVSRTPDGNVLRNVVRDAIESDPRCATCDEKTSGE